MSRDRFHLRLNQVEQMMDKMGEIIHDLLSEIIIVFQTNQLNEEKVSSIIARESKMDELEFNIEQLSMELIALQQPMAIDLRHIMCMIKMSMDLERIGDHIRKIVKKTQKVVELGESGHFTPLAEMVILLRMMVDQIMIAYKENNIKLAKSTLKLDENINEIQRRLFREYIEKIKKEPNETVISSEIHLLFITRFLERIGDHVENIGERVIYKVTGDINQLKK